MKNIVSLISFFEIVSSVLTTPIPNRAMQNGAVGTPRLAFC